MNLMCLINLTIVIGYAILFTVALLAHSNHIFYIVPGKIIPDKGTGRLVQKG